MPRRAGVDVNWTVIVVAGMACLTAIFVTSLIVGARTTQQQNQDALFAAARLKAGRAP